MDVCKCCHQVKDCELLVPQLFFTDASAQRSRGVTTILMLSIADCDFVFMLLLFEMHQTVLSKPDSAVMPVGNHFVVTTVMQFMPKPVTCYTPFVVVDWL